jgi:hypothetical protein
VGADGAEHSRVAVDQNDGWNEDVGHLQQSAKAKGQK